MVQEQELSLLRSRFKDLFHYCDKTGDLTRLQTRCGRALSGSKVRSPNSQGYYRVYVDGERYFAHRVIFLMVYGYLPKQVDHINQDKTDNRIDNLRPATHAQNMFNRPIFKNNTTGRQGVDFKDGKYRARIQVDGKSEYIGKFNCLEEASSAYEKRRIELQGDVFPSRGQAKRVI